MPSSHSHTAEVQNKSSQQLEQETTRAMGKGRGSASLVVGAALVLSMLLVLQYSEMAHAASFVVGGSSGWTFNLVSWPKGKRFRAGDTLVFNYSPGAHNVVAVNKAGFDRCTAPKGARTFQSGKDQIKLGKGLNYFICTFPGHCQAGMKIAVTAA